MSLDEKSTEKAPEERAREKAAGKRPLLDYSPPPPPTRLRLARSSEKPASSRGVPGPVDTSVKKIPLG